MLNTLPLGYGWVLFFACVFALQLIVAGLAAMAPRKKFFTKEFFEKNFPEEVKQGLVDLKAGYPDTGSGRYSAKLSHSQWVDVNNAQRAHLNFLESFAPAVIFMLISGLSFPRYTVVFQLIYIVGRALYQILYTAKGPSGRAIGALLGVSSLFALAGGALFSAFTLGGGAHGLFDLFVGGK